MCDEDRRILLERCGERDDGDVLLTRRHHLQRIGHRDVELAGGEQLQPVHLRPAHADLHVETVLAIRSLGDGLVVAAVLGLGEPVRRKEDPLQRLRARAAARGRNQQQSADRKPHQ